MKKLLFTFSVMLLLCSSALAAGQVDMEYFFERPRIESVTIGGETFDRIIMNGAPRSGSAGEPALPARGANILLPAGVEIENIEIVPGEKVLLGGDYFVEPMSQPVKLSADHTSPQAPTPDEKIYSSHTLFPAMAFETIGTFIFRGYQIVTLKLHPVQYLPATGQLYYFTSLKVIVNTSESGGLNPLWRGLETDRMAVQAKVDNPEIAGTYPVAKRGQKAFDLLILTTPSLASSFQPLKSHHDANGIPTEIRTTTDVGSSNPDDVRAYITQRYLLDGIDYVLIGADDDLIPAKDLYVKSWEGSGAEIETAMPGDIFFACLDGTWNYDGDSYWGEPTDGDGGGDVDLVAEVYVGRAAVGNSTEADRFVNKTIQYLDATDTYLQKVLMVGEYLGFGGISDYAGPMMDQIVDGSSADGYTTVGIPSDEYDVDRLYEQNYNWSQSDLTSRINSGLHIINHLGHGSPDYAMKLYDSDIMSELTNGNHCLVYSQTCLAGHFDGTDCWAEYMNIKTDAGGFAIVMNARYGWGLEYSTDGPSQRFNREFWDAVFNASEAKPELGPANHDSKEDNLYRINESCMRWCYYQLNLFGDPTVTVKGFGGLAFSYPDGIPSVAPPDQTTSFAVVVSGTGDGTPVPGSGQLHYRINSGPLQTDLMTETLPNNYEAVLPALSCGDDFEFYVSAEELTAGRIYDPDPASPNILIVASSVTVVFEDNFETAMGWTVSGNATDGQWDRGVPIGGGDRGDPPTDYDGSGQCYLTDNVDGNSDVDGGTTTLISPTFDLSSGDAEINYARWYSNNNGADPFNDEMHIYISNNNGSSWILVETVGPVDQAGGGWYENTFMAGSYVTPTAQMKLRFDASDLGLGSVVEAAVDAVSVTVYECSGAPQVVIVTNSLPEWTQNLAGYNATLQAANGTEPYVWSDKYGDLVGTGLSLSSTGIISGTPSTAGMISFTARVEDNLATFDEKLLSITVNPEPQITTSSLPDWTVGILYNQTLVAVGGTGALTWSDADGGLAGTGLTLHPTTGQLLGVPTSDGLISLTARVTDSLGAVANKPLTILINPVLAIATAIQLAPWVVGMPGYADILEATGGTGSHTWSNPGGDLAGSGLSLSAGGQVTGTPTTAGTVNFTGRVTDDIGASDQDTFLIEVYAALEITSDSTLPNWTANHPGYSVTLTAMGGLEPMVWSDKYGNLTGTGLVLSSAGVLTGTPSTIGLISFTASVQDSMGQTDEQQFNLTVNPEPAISSDTLLAAWTVNHSGYSTTLTTTGGTPPLTFTEQNFHGLHLDAAGNVAGTPDTAAAIVFTAILTDNVGASNQKQFTIPVNPRPVIVTDSLLPEWTEGVPGYSVMLQATGGTGALVYSEVGTGLTGTGLVLGSDGLISGTPNTAGTINFTAEVADDIGATDSKPFAINILPAYICGDADGNGLVNIADVTYLVAYIFAGGPPPDPLASGDVDCNGSVNIADVVYLINYIFGGGPPPCQGCSLATGESKLPVMSD